MEEQLTCLRIIPMDGGFGTLPRWHCEILPRRPTVALCRLFHTPRWRLMAGCGPTAIARGVWWHFRSRPLPACRHRLLSGIRTAIAPTLSQISPTRTN